MVDVVLILYDCVWYIAVVNTPEHQKLAKYAADSSLVLLKNNGKTLPLTKKSGMKLLVKPCTTDIHLHIETKTCAQVAGRNANATSNMQGNYFGTAPFLISPCQGLAAYADVRCRSSATGISPIAWIRVVAWVYDSEFSAFAYGKPQLSSVGP